MARSPDRTPGGELLLGASPNGRSYHAGVGGMAACSLALPVSNARPLSQVALRERCDRRRCREHWQRERAVPAVAGDAEHVCPSCFVERDKRTPACPSCASTYRAIPEALAA